ncbi:unnamed protein product [Sphagnum balticum]
MEEAQGFISALVKLAVKGNIRAYDSILKLAAFDNLTLGRCWDQIVKFMFQMEDSEIVEHSSFDMSIIDQILTATSGLPQQKFVEFLQAILQLRQQRILEKADETEAIVKVIDRVVTVGLDAVRTPRNCTK